MSWEEDVNKACDRYSQSMNKAIDKYHENIKNTALRRLNFVFIAAYAIGFMMGYGMAALFVKVWVWQ